MSNRFLIVLSLASLILVSCKKKEETPTGPYLVLKLGFLKKVSPYDVSPFLNQQTQSLQAFSTDNYIGLSVHEFNHPKDFEPVDTLNNQIEVLTTNDRENFELGGVWIMNNPDNTSIEFRTGSKYKISQVATPYNDTLEISPVGDLIRVNYKSPFSDIEGIKILNITPY